MMAAWLMGLMATGMGHVATMPATHGHGVAAA
eukprot:CAMPEP_0185160968 /NCGR_PEP_ID=MMETSP1139-20130426/4282_1 /TAXON_ID=298111 /ORGANISM="Pavlova sp., Strain CCMP459" /LENGTH=31 /DNA_ID= /DNA_START= /DNA_END= /DNA_ORIENTATION=